MSIRLGDRAMHEVDMTRCLLLSMNQWKQRHAPHTPQVRRVHLQVGTFTCVEPQQLVTTWRAAVQGSWLEGVGLVIDTVPLVGRCVVCNGTYKPDPGQAYRSPCCDHPLEEIVSGRELRIRSVEYSLDTATDFPPANPFTTAAAV
ncbi:MAG: hydrogenase maturation nickel metallochaperone HypA [Cyanobium sp.]